MSELNYIGVMLHWVLLHCFLFSDFNHPLSSNTPKVNERTFRLYMFLTSSHQQYCFPCVVVPQCAGFSWEYLSLASDIGGSGCHLLVGGVGVPSSWGEWVSPPRGESG